MLTIYPISIRILTLPRRRTLKLVCKDTGQGWYHMQVLDNAVLLLTRVFVFID